LLQERAQIVEITLAVADCAARRSRLHVVEVEIDRPGNAGFDACLDDAGNPDGRTGSNGRVQFNLGQIARRSFIAVIVQIEAVEDVRRIPRTEELL